MSKPWSKLQSKLYELVDPKAKFQIHVAVYKLNSLNPMSSHPYQLPRYWITIGKDIIFDFPRQFEERFGPWTNDVPKISELIRDYIDCPKDEILTKDFEDKYGITDILKLVDKRVGKEKFKTLLKSNRFTYLLDEKCIDPSVFDKISKNRW